MLEYALVENLGRCTHGNDVAAVHDGDAVAEAQGERQVMNNHRTGHPLLMNQPTGQAHHVERRAGVQVGRGLVEQHGPCPLGEHHRDKRPLPLAARKRAGSLVRQMLNTGNAHRLGNNLPILLGQSAKQPHMGIASARHKCLHRHGRRAVNLGQQRNTLGTFACRQAVESITLNERLARGWLQHAIDHAQQGRLAAAVGPDDARQATRGQCKR